MNYNQRFDEHIKEQLQDYTPPVHPRIWENIANKREKKRPAGFWFTLLNQRSMVLLAGLLLLAGAGGYFLFNSRTADINEQTAVSTTLTKEAAATENTAAATTAPEAAAGNAPGNLPAAAANANSAVTANNTPAASTSNAGRNIVNSLGKSGQATATENNNLFAATGGAKKYNRQASQKIKIKNGVAAYEEANTGEATGEPEADYVLPFKFFTAEKNTTPKTVAALNKRRTANVKEPGCPTIEENAAGNKTYIEVYGGPDMAFRSMSDTGNSVYLQKRKESTKFSSAFSAGIRYTKVFNNGVSIRTGINYSQINEKFTYNQGNIVQVVYIINATGDTIGSYTTTGSRYKTTYNKFRTLDIPVVLGYEIGNGNFHTNINAGVIINAYSWQKGEVLDRNLQPVDITTGKSSSPYQFKTNIGVGFIGSVSLYYKMNEKLHLMAEPYFRYNLAPASKEIITFKQKYNTAGLRLGLRLDIR
jgi:hypothetical protein